MFPQQPPLKIFEPLSTEAVEIQTTPKNHRRHYPYDAEDGRRRNNIKKAMYDYGTTTTVQHPSPPFPCAGGSTGFSLGNDEIQPPAMVSQNTPMEWSPAFHPSAGATEVAGFGSVTNQWLPPPPQRLVSGHPTFIQDERNQSNSLLDTSFASHGNDGVDITIYPQHPSKSIISPHLYKCTTPWDPTLASIPYQDDITYPPADYPQEQWNAPENPFRSFSNRAPSNPAGSQPAFLPTPHPTTFHPPDLSVAAVASFNEGATLTQSNMLNCQQGQGPLAVSCQMDTRHGTGGSVEMPVHTIQLAPAGHIGNWGQSQDISRPDRHVLDSSNGTQAPSGTRSLPSNDFSLQASPIHMESASQRARSVESFFVNRKQPSQPPPVVAPRLATMNPIDTSLRQFQQGSNSRYEQDSAYAMLWPPTDIQAEVGDLFVNADSVTSGRRTWIRDATGWTPIAS